MIAGAHYNCTYILMSASTFLCFQLGSRFIGFHTDTFGFKLAVPSLFESTSIPWNSYVTEESITASTKIIISSSAIALTGTLEEC